MPEVYVGVGSNVEPERHVREAIVELERRFGQLSLSTVYRTEPVGFVGDPFLNMVVGFRSSLGIARLLEVLHEIETQCGRKRSEQRFGPRSMDLDLLLYGDTVSEDPPLPRPEIMQYPFVLGPLSEIAGGRIHPGNSMTYAELWAEKRELYPAMAAVSMQW